MSNRLFDANSWINGLEFAEDNKGQSGEATPSPQGTSQSVESAFAPLNCFVPGWTGQSLVSNDALDISKTVSLLKADAKKKFQLLKDANPTLHSAVFNEFLEFANTFDHSFHQISGERQFWQHVLSESSPYSKELETFVDYYTHRIVVVYLYKLKFISLLGNALNIPVSINHLINTSSFLMGIFRPGGSTELSSKAIKSNKYSWYRPSKSLADELAVLAEKLQKISITETMKISTYRNQELEESLSFKDKSYSHAISHKAFGFFINHILINFPKWINKENGKQHNAKGFGSSESIPKVVSCKFQGSYLNSFILSHWLAQKECIEEKWDQLICPDCVEDEYGSGEFIRLCHELQLISYLVQFGKTHELDVVAFICKVMSERQGRGPKGQQLGLFQSGVERNYDRIVLNLDLPKSNPHHHLLSKINKQKHLLAQGGFIYVLTNQKLFVPSQKGKIEQLFKELKLEGYFNFENLNGRGEIPQYLFVFTKREELTNINDIFNFGNFTQPSSTQKETCFTFRMSGELKMFSHFMELVEEMSNFFNDRNPYATPFYQVEPVEELHFEFYQDAIVDGTLHSITKDSSTFTHPAFFANINKSCIPLEQVFKVQNLEDKGTYSSDGLFGQVIGGNNRFPYLLVVNLTDPKNITLELTSGETYLAKRKQYGTACFHYYGLVPKLNGLNINLFKEYFESDLGAQIIQLCLSSSSKLKSQINSLLIPEFFANTSTRIPGHIGQSFGFLALSQDELEKTHPKTLVPQMDLLKQQLDMLSKRYPWDTMGRLCFFKHNIECCLEKFKTNYNKSHHIDFSNPQLFRPLARLKAMPIIKHEDIDIRPLSADLHLPLEIAQIVTSDLDGTTERLVFKSNDQEIVEFYSSKELLRFIKYIVSPAKGAPIGQLIGHLQLPSESELKTIIDSFVDLSDSYQELYSQTKNLVRKVLNSQIS